MPRIQITRLRAAAATALLSFLLAAPAFASHDGWDDDDYGDRRGYPVYRHDRHCDRDSHGWGDRNDYGDRDHYREGRRHREYGAYGCRQCGRRWSDRGSFHRHLSREHGIPFRHFPSW
jgi:hypothetical protein